MEEIISIFNNECPTFDQKPLSIDKFEFLDNPRLQAIYNNIGNEKLLFHGTVLRNLDAIISEGFDISLAGMSMPGHIGKGMYFSDLICQSIYYQLKERYIGNETMFKLLVCKVSLGRSIYLERKGNQDIPKIIGYDSHITNYSQGQNSGHEYCIFDREQILPYCILHMSTL